MASERRVFTGEVVGGINADAMYLRRTFSDGGLTWKTPAEMLGGLKGKTVRITVEVLDEPPAGEVRK
jgi:hypothetical protein